MQLLSSVTLAFLGWSVAQHFSAVGSESIKITPIVQRSLPGFSNSTPGTRLFTLRYTLQLFCNNGTRNFRHVLWKNNWRGPRVAVISPLAWGVPNNYRRQFMVVEINYRYFLSLYFGTSIEDGIIEMCKSWWSSKLQSGGLENWFPWVVLSSILFGNISLTPNKKRRQGLQSNIRKLGLQEIHHITIMGPHIFQTQEKSHTWETQVLHWTKRGQILLEVPFVPSMVLTWADRRCSSPRSYDHRRRSQTIVAEWLPGILAS